MIAMKIVMALSGLLFVFYVLMHMYGNLKVFAGQDAFDEYAHHLRTIGEPILPYTGFLWLFRILLIVALFAHAGSAYYLWSRARGARTTRYQVSKAIQASLSSKMMRWGGTFLLLWLVFHLLQYTTNTICDSVWRALAMLFTSGRRTLESLPRCLLRRVGRSSAET